MPERYRDTVTARSMVLGDMIINRVGQPEKHRGVIKVEVKEKYTYITTEGGAAPERVLHATEYVVERTRPTAEERKTRELRRTLEEIDFLEQRDRARLVDLQQRVSKQVLNGQMSMTGAYEILAAQQRVAIWNRISHITKIRATTVWSMQVTMHTNPQAAPTLLEAIELDMSTHVPTRLSVVRWVQQKLMSDLLMRIDFVQSSTSGPYQFERSIENQVQLDWCKQFDFSLDLLSDEDVPPLPVRPNPAV